MRDDLYGAFLLVIFFVAAGYGAFYYAHMGLSEGMATSIHSKVGWILASACVSALLLSLWFAGSKRHALAALLALSPVPLALGASLLAVALSR